MAAGPIEGFTYEAVGLRGKRSRQTPLDSEVHSLLPVVARPISASGVRNLYSLFAFEADQTFLACRWPLLCHLPMSQATCAQQVHCRSYTPSHRCVAYAFPSRNPFPWSLQWVCSTGATYPSSATPPSKRNPSSYPYMPTRLSLPTRNELPIPRR